MTVFTPSPSSTRRPRLVTRLALAFVYAYAVLTSGPGLLAQGPIISEFLAANGTGITDAEGEASDWIEIFNPEPRPVSLEGWHLTDTPRTLNHWRFPAVTVPAQGFVVVFASGKDRADAGGEIHTNFKLDRAGEFLALVEPDGRTVASLFPLPYPRHVSDVSYGLAMTRDATDLVPHGATARLLIPTDDQLGRGWTAPEYDDTAWRPVALGVGYHRPAAEGPEPAEPAPELQDVTRPTDFIVPTSGNSPGNEGVLNAIDGIPQTKYLNFDKLNAGLTVTPSAGPSVVTGLRLTSANDAPDRDPTSFLLSASNDGRTFVEIARGPVSMSLNRFTPVAVAFTNTTAWSHYRLLFPTVRNATAAVAVQVAEVELLGWFGSPPADFETLVRTSIEDSLHRKASGAYIRVAFTAADSPAPAALTLAVRYDDGFVAWLNGVEVARANAPANPVAGSLATTNHLRRDAAAELRINLSQHTSLLRSGNNVLALHGLNSRPDSGEFLLDARLERSRIHLGATGHLLTPTPGAVNPSSVGGLVDDVLCVPPRGFYTAPIQVSLACPTPGTTIRYTTNGSAPGPTNGFVYSGPFPLSRTTPLRAAAIRTGWRPSRIATHTYLFAADIITQDRAATLAAGFPATWSGTAADYGLDRRVIGQGGTDAFNGRYTAAFTAELRALPSVSLVMPIDDMFGPQGIYANPESRGDAWERGVSFEWIPGDQEPAFQEDGGVRIQGGAFRRFDLTRKKSFRLVFRERYGATQLRQALFGPDATDRFDNFVLRANSNDAWPYGGGRAVYVHDAFAMETARALGIPASRSRFVHLYLNGFYWGLYNPVERPDAAFSEAYLGGDKDTWDSINQDSAPDGNYDAWNRMISQLSQDMSKTENYQRIQGNHPDGTRNPAYENLIDVDNLIDYLILNFYVGNSDWPGRNWWAARQRVDNADRGFQFRPWDTETALSFTGVDADVTGARDAVARPYAALRANADFRLRFADHVFRHFFHGGPLFVNPANPRWDPAAPTHNLPAARFAALAAAVRPGIVGESARWGDQSGGNPFTRDEHWAKERDSLLAGYFPVRSARVLAQFRQAGLYPRTDPPSMSQRGGLVSGGYPLLLTAPEGVVYYTLDGRDPRGAGGSVTGTRYTGPVILHSGVTLRTRTLSGSEWSALNEATFDVRPPEFAALAFEARHEPPNQVRLRFMGRAGLGYTMYQRDSLAAGEWTVLHTGIPRPADGWAEMLVEAPPAAGTRFYRVSIP